MRTYDDAFSGQKIYPGKVCGHDCVLAFWGSGGWVLRCWPAAMLCGGLRKRAKWENTVRRADIANLKSEEFFLRGILGI